MPRALQKDPEAVAPAQHHTEEIGHAQEANQTLVGIDWQHLWSHMMLSHTFAPPLTHKGTRTAELEVAKVSPRPLALPPPLSPSFWQWMNAWLFLFFWWEIFLFPFSFKYDINTYLKRHIAKVLNPNNMGSFATQIFFIGMPFNFFSK